MSNIATVCTKYVDRYSLIDPKKSCIVYLHKSYEHRTNSRFSSEIAAFIRLHQADVLFSF